MICMYRNLQLAFFLGSSNLLYTSYSIWSWVVSLLFRHDTFYSLLRFLPFLWKSFTAYPPSSPPSELSLTFISKLDASLFTFPLLPGLSDWICANSSSLFFLFLLGDVLGTAHFSQLPFCGEHISSEWRKYNYLVCTKMNKIKIYRICNTPSGCMTSSGTCVLCSRESIQSRASNDTQLISQLTI